MGNFFVFICIVICVQCSGAFAGITDYEDYQFPDITADTKQTLEFCYNPDHIKNVKPSLNCPTGELIEIVAENQNQTFLNYTYLSSDCQEFTKSVHRFILSRAGEQCSGRSNCTMSIEKVDDFHFSNVLKHCPEFGTLFFNRICLSIVYVCIHLSGMQ